jgi:hypothetical protein
MPKTETTATAKANARLEHSKGGVTTRDDATDVGVPMLPGDASEPQGPEDALGIGPKRGDYTNRLGGSSYQPHETLPVTDAKEGESRVRIEAQHPRAEDIGEAKGLKGGVNSAR